MRVLPAEWQRQRTVLLSFPHEQTDWHDPEDPQKLQASLSPFVRIAQAIAYNEAVYILCHDRAAIASLFCSTDNMTFIEIETNDTWIRDYGYISLKEEGVLHLLDFTFDGWGGKFEASLDNRANATLHRKGYMGTTPLTTLPFVLEGGSIESDGAGTILTTSVCLCNPNRNGGLNKTILEQRLHEYLGAKRVLWLDHGYLAGDDTDSHIDTLARFVSRDTIVYLQCSDPQDEHYTTLQAMEQQLHTFRTLAGDPYTLIPLPMTEPIYNEEGRRLPATYANFLITNHALLYPTYGDHADKHVGELFKSLFPDREIIPINSLKLIEQGGSLHCSTMQVAQ